MARFLDTTVLSSIPVKDFRATQPFPWIDLAGFLTDEGFAQLRRDFPSVELFEEHKGIERMYDQRPHDRYYLAYEASIYHPGDAERGVVRRDDLAPSWQQFLDELASDEYMDFIRTCIGIRDLEPRFAWHLGVTGSEVSPHVDTPEKAATQIFYFNDPEEWDPDWGGATLVLVDRIKDALNPDFEDFRSAIPVETLGNHSFLFRNEPNGWHGVRTLTCPPGSFRRLFNVIFDHAPRKPTMATRLKGRIRDLVKG